MCPQWCHCVRTNEEKDQCAHRILSAMQENWTSCIPGKFMYELWLVIDKEEKSKGLIQLVKKCILLKIYVLWMQKWMIKQQEK